VSRFAEFEKRLHTPGRPGDYLRTLAELSDYIRTLPLDAGTEGKGLHVLFTETLAWLLEEAKPAYLESVPEQASTELPS
jgi:hypothetical protein